MINIFLADDENFVRIGIRSVVNWEENGYKIIGEAGNGKEAIEKILQLNPDIVLLDITMPIVNGISVLKEIRQKGYKGYVAMLTCHSNFEFAQKGIKYQANDYILKNDISGEKLLEYLNGIDKKIYLKKDSNENNNSVQIKEYKSNFLLNVLRIGIVDKLDLEKIFKRYELKIKKTDIYLITVKIEDYDRVIGRYEKNGYEILSSSMGNIFHNTMEKYHEFEVVKYSQDLFIILVTFSKDKSQNKINSHIENIVKEITYATQTFLNINTVMAIRCNQKGLEQIHKSFDKTKILLGQIYFNPNRRIFYSYEKYCFDENDIILYKFKDCLNKVLDLKTDFNISEIVSGLINKIKKDNIIVNKTKFDFILANFLEQLSLAQNISVNIDINSIDNINVLIKEFEKLDSLLNEKIDKPYNYLIVQTLEIIDKSFTTNISLDDIASRIGVTSSYISRLFSKSMDKTISNYILEKRIEYAKNLISTTNLKHYQVAEQCGFNSAIHFTNMFKKYCGINPNEYRNKRI